MMCSLGIPKHCLPSLSLCCRGVFAYNTRFYFIIEKSEVGTEANSHFHSQEQKERNPCTPAPASTCKRLAFSCPLPQAYLM